MKLLPLNINISAVSSKNLKHNFVFQYFLQLKSLFEDKSEFLHVKKYTGMVNYEQSVILNFNICIWLMISQKCHVILILLNSHTFCVLTVKYSLKLDHVDLKYFFDNLKETMFLYQIYRAIFEWLNTFFFWLWHKKCVLIEKLHVNSLIHYIL